MRAILVTSGTLTDAGKTTVVKNLAHHYQARFISVDNTRDKPLPDGEDERYQMSEVQAMIGNIDIYRDQRYVAEIGGDAFPGTISDLSKTANWGSIFDLIVCVFNPERKPALFIAGIQELLRAGAPRDKITVIFNNVTNANRKSKFVRDVVNFCLQNDIDVCEHPLPRCEGFDVQHGKQESILAIAAEDAFDAAYDRLFAAATDEEVAHWGRQVACRWYAKVLAELAFPPLLDHLDGRIAAHG